MTTTAKDRPVVVGVDGSDADMAAVRWEPTRLGVHGAPVGGAAVDLGSVAVLAGFYSEVLDRPWRRPPTGRATCVSCPILEDGHPANVLLRQAPHTQLLVLDSRGRGGFAGILLRSTSLQVATHAHSPVLVLRSGVAGLADGPSAG